MLKSSESVNVYSRSDSYWTMHLSLRWAHLVHLLESLLYRSLADFLKTSFISICKFICKTDFFVYWYSKAGLIEKECTYLQLPHYQKTSLRYWRCARRQLHYNLKSVKMIVLRSVHYVTWHTYNRQYRSEPSRDENVEQLDIFEQESWDNSAGMPNTFHCLY